MPLRDCLSLTYFSYVQNYKVFYRNFLFYIFFLFFQYPAYTPDSPWNIYSHLRTPRIVKWLSKYHRNLQRLHSRALGIFTQIVFSNSYSSLRCFCSCTAILMYPHVSNSMCSKRETYVKLLLACRWHRRVIAYRIRSTQILWNYSLPAKSSNSDSNLVSFRSKRLYNTYEQKKIIKILVSFICKF